MPMMTGARFLAETLHGYGVTHVFLVPGIVRKALMEMEELGIKRIVTHGEKAAAYMADGYARVSNSPAVCLAQSVGALNLAASIRDLTTTPIIWDTARDTDTTDRIQPSVLLGLAYTHSLAGGRITAGIASRAGGNAADESGDYAAP